MKDNKLERLLLFSIPTDIFLASVIILSALDKIFTVWWWIAVAFTLINGIGDLLGWVLEKIEDEE